MEWKYFLLPCNERLFHWNYSVEVWHGGHTIVWQYGRYVILQCVMCCILPHDIYILLYGNTAGMSYSLIRQCVIPHPIAIRYIIFSAECGNTAGMSYFHSTKYMNPVGVWHTPLYYRYFIIDCQNVFFSNPTIFRINLSINRNL